jgi:serine/threonine protein phosphatase PrpC
MELIHTRTNEYPQFGHVSIGGTDPDRPGKVNQDGYFLDRIAVVGAEEGRDEQYMTLFGIMDGHGLKGHVLVDYLKTQIPHRLRQCMKLLGQGEEEECLSQEEEEQVETFVGKMKSLGNFHEKVPPSENAIETALAKAFILSHVDACQDVKVPAGRSGTTCIVCVIDETKRKIYTAHVGDSRGIMGRFHNEGPEQLIAFQEQLSHETKVDIPSERSRIEQSEGNILAGTENVFYGPVGIAMTRALGDAVMLRAGVVPMPVINSIHLSPEIGSSLFCLGTDGIFDEMSNTDVVETISRTYADAGEDRDSAQRIQNAAEAIATEATSRWQADLPIEVKRDDITCLLVRI